MRRRFLNELDSAIKASAIADPTWELGRRWADPLAAAAAMDDIPKRRLLHERLSTLGQTPREQAAPLPIAMERMAESIDTASHSEIQKKLDDVEASMGELVTVQMSAHDLVKPHWARKS